MGKIILLLAFLVLAGCGDIKVVRNNPFEKGSDQYIKSYNIGEQKTTYIGDPIIKWQEARVKYTDDTKMFYAKTDFEIKGKYTKANKLFGSDFYYKSIKNDQYYYIGTASYDGNDYYVIAKDKEDNDCYLLIDYKGRLYKKIIIDEHLDRKLMFENLNTTPAEVVFLKTKLTNKSLALGLSREIIFGGVNNITMNATYREYTPDDMARQAFYQNLVYQTTADIIRFRGFKIKVHEVTNEKITFTVLEDGLANTESEVSYK